MVDYWFCDWWFRVLPHLIVSSKFPLWSPTEMRNVINQPECVLTLTEFMVLFFSELLLSQKRTCHHTSSTLWVLAHYLKCYYNVTWAFMKCGKKYSLRDQVQGTIVVSHADGSYILSLKQSSIFPLPAGYGVSWEQAVQLAPFPCHCRPFRKDHWVPAPYSVL